MEDSADGNEIQAEVERLRANAPDTKALYREVAAMLFFRFGIAPTANRLHQLVGKGSMSTSAAALSRFWKDLREQGRLRIEHPAVPGGLREVAGALVGQIWKSAVATADADLAGVREELDARVQSAELKSAEAQQRLEQATEAVLALKADLEAATEQARSKDEHLVARALEVQRLQGQLEATAQGLRDRDAAVESARKAFAAELEGLRKAIDLTEERARSTERKAMAEVDKARSQIKHIEKALSEEQRKRATELKRFETTLTKRENELQVLREQSARAEGVASTTKSQLATAEQRLSRLLAKTKPISPSGQPRKRSPCAVGSL